MGQAASALPISRLPKRRKLIVVPSPGSDHQPPRNSPEKWLDTVAAWKAELRAFGRGHAPANYLKLKFEDVVCRGGGCAELRAQLAALGATAPSCVYARKLPSVQADLRHGRLSVGAPWQAHHTEALPDGELDAIIDDDRTGGLNVPVLDREGRRYDFKCVYAEDTGFYRLTGTAEYERFMADKNVVRDVDEGKELFMELWAFRTPALGNKGRASAGDQHPEGDLGMVILFFDLDADGLGDELFDDDSITIKQLMRHYPKGSEEAAN
ncbi:LOW QUALITY PROTEIN: hypothetical protein PAHAL_3G296900 [Panicum hallii]|uniref:Uncharacterized protein n=1 Tax=Panicum hallii TaxID=206008 RepID=A0A2S3HCK7_9POAL|nr:LOW QUALITY PROTEIN: hypothetical protein PAHAL_3G296900 [Panicum hallii]